MVRTNGGRSARTLDREVTMTGYDSTTETESREGAERRPTGDRAARVDVGERRIRVGVLSLHNSKETKEILNAVDALGHDPVWLREENLSVRIDRDGVRIDPDVDVVINRLLLSKGRYVIEDLELANTLAAARPTVNRPNAVLNAVHKYAAATRIAEAGLPTPASSLALSPPELEDERRQLADDDGVAVQKAAIGTHGESIWRIDEDRNPHPTVGGRRTFLQRFLDQDGSQSDVRAYVVGDRVVAAMRRDAPADDWRTNVAGGGDVIDLGENLPARVREFAVEATSVVGLDVAGVDLLRKGDEWYVIEVNPTAGFKGLYEATGTSPGPYIANLALDRVGGDASDERVEALTTALDDSVPDCKPEPPERSTGTPTVGYIEEVRLDGRGGPAQATAKVDTGAARTSVGINIAADVEAGPILSSTDVRSAGSGSRTRPLVEIDLAVAGRWHTVTASVEDRSNMNYPLLLGRDVLSNYRIELDEGEAESGPSGDEE